jgi:hypothetical protein
MIDADFYAEVKVDDCFWTMEDKAGGLLRTSARPTLIRLFLTSTSV